MACRPCGVGEGDVLEACGVQRVGHVDHREARVAVARHHPLVAEPGELVQLGGALQVREQPGLVAADVVDVEAAVAGEVGPLEGRIDLDFQQVGGLVGVRILRGVVAADEHQGLLAEPVGGLAGAQRHPGLAAVVAVGVHVGCRVRRRRSAGLLRPTIFRRAGEHPPEHVSRVAEPPDLGYRPAVLILGLLTAFADAGPGQAPPPLALSSDQEATLDAGDVVVLFPEGGETVGVIDVSATPDEVVDAVLDLEARVDEVALLRTLTLYRDEGDVRGGLYVGGMLGIHANIHVLYQCDRTQGWCVFSLDDAYESSVDSAEGSYQAYAVSGATRLVFRTTAGSDLPVPSFVRHKVQSASVSEQLEGIAGRAAASAAR